MQKITFSLHILLHTVCSGIAPVWARFFSCKSLTAGLGLLFLLGFYSSSLYGQTLEWANIIGGTWLDRSFAVAVDNSGNTIITGCYSDTVDFDPGSGATNLVALSPNPLLRRYDAFIAKYDTKGNYVWVVNLPGAANNDYGQGVAVDGSGNVYVTGYFYGTVDFDPGSGISSLTVKDDRGRYSDIFLAKYDANGNYVWARSIGGKNYNEYGYGIAVDKSGNVYVTGQLMSQDTIFFGDQGILLKQRSAYDAFIAKFDSNGNYIWAMNMGDINESCGNGIATDSIGNVYVTGHFTGTVDFDPDSGVANLVSIGGARDQAIFIAKYDTDGKYLWAKGMGGVGTDRYNMTGRAIAVDDSGNVCITGVFIDTIDFDPDQGVANLVSLNGNRAVFIAKYDTNGNYLWATSPGNSGNNSYGGIAVDKSGNINVTGCFLGTADFDPGPDTVMFNSAGGMDVFIAKYDKNGNYIWAGSMGGGGDDFGCGIALDMSGNVYTTGWIHTMGAYNNNLNPQPEVDTFFTSAGGNDLFLLKLGCSSDTSYFTVSLCGSSYNLNDSIYTSSGTYTQIFPNALGCDSTITLDLTLIPIEKPIINVSGFTLGITNAYTYISYQWLQNGAVIPGATDSILSVSENADYQVIVTNQHGCQDTSAIYIVDNVNIKDAKLQSLLHLLYPNPTPGNVTIQSSQNFNNATIRVVNLTGQTIATYRNQQGTTFTFDIGSYANGIYFVEVSEAGKTARMKVVKKE